jgi:hypothetical protein
MPSLPSASLSGYTDASEEYTNSIANSGNFVANVTYDDDDDDEDGLVRAHLSPAAAAMVRYERLVLADLLIAFSALDDAVGYCQGMNFVAAVLLKHMPKQYALFVMEAIVRRYNYEGVYAAGLERVGLSFYQVWFALLCS